MATPFRCGANSIDRAGNPPAASRTASIDSRNVWDRGMVAMLWRYRRLRTGKRRIVQAAKGWR